MKERMAAYPPHLDLDVVGFGNALVDVLSHQDDEFIEQIGAMGPMTLLHKDMHCIVESMEEMGVQDSLSKKVHAMYDKLINQDRSAGTPIRDGMGLIYLYEEMFDVNVVDVS